LNSLFVAWQDPDSQAWFPVGKLSRVEGLYHFCYLQGAVIAQREASFPLVWSFPDLYRRYSSIELYPLFTNRLLRRSRPEYQDFLQWLNLPQSQNDPIAILARSGGHRQTDTFEVFPYAERNSQGYYHIPFFAHGLRDFPKPVLQYLYQLQPQTPLQIIHDAQNQFEACALMLQTKDRQTIGFCPQYINQNFFELIKRFPQKVQVTLEKVNLPPAPLQFRLLCSLTAPWEEDFQPFTSNLYQPLVPEKFEAISA
jgi:hypothetical protein